MKKLEKIIFKSHISVKKVKKFFQNYYVIKENELFTKKLFDSIVRKNSKLARKGEKHMKRKEVLLSVAILTIATICLSIFSFILKGTESTKELISISAKAEELRAMTFGEITEEDEKTNSEYVKFSAFFVRDLDGDGYAEKVKGTCKEVGTTDTLYMSINVLTEGTLVDGKIELLSDNFYFQTALLDDEVLKGNYISSNTKILNLKDMSAGTQKLIFGNVRTGDYNYESTKTAAIGNDTTKYSKVNQIKFTGTHIDNDGNETKVERIIELPVEWYSTTNAEIPYTYGSNNEKNKYQNYSTENIIDEANNLINLQFKIATQETNNKLILSKSYIEGEIPEFNGYAPISVEVTGTNVIYTYDETTRIFTAQRQAKVNENGIITEVAYSGENNGKRYNEYNLKVTYPIEAYTNLNDGETISMNIPVKAYYEGYNNTNEEFSNPYRSNIAQDIISVVFEKMGGDVIRFDITVGTWVSQPYNVNVISKKNPVMIYNGEKQADEIEDTYQVRWYAVRGGSGTVDGLKMVEQDSNYTDKFLTIGNQYIDMIDYSKNIGIYFTGAGAMFGQDGYIDVINDETDELIHRFTIADWDLYTSENPYMYEHEINHIRIETSVADKSCSFVATSIKKLDDGLLTDSFTREEFNELSKIYSYLSGYAKLTGDTDYTLVNNDIEFANYDEPLSMAVLNSINPNYLSTQETKENVKIEIGTVNLAYNVVEWKNGEFLLKFPSDIIVAKINDITISNSSVSIVGYELYKEDGSYFIRILTENDEPATYNITIDADLTPDPRNLSANRKVELYAYNEACSNYKNTIKDDYDVNSNGNTEELVNYSTKEIMMIGPSSLLTNQTASDYNNDGDIAIAPQIAEIDKLLDDKTAKISVQITNNYSGRISEVKLIGKIPFEGNTYVLNEKELGSTFTTSMTGPLVLPEELVGIAKVYYSTNENPTTDLLDEQNGWTQDVTDFSNIRTYLIDLEDYVLEKGETHICTYEIEVPDSANYNDITYSTHAVYFYLETDEGKLQDKTETNKLGFMIAKKYNFELLKLKTNTNIPIQNAVFKLTDEDTNETKLKYTDEKGELCITDLYVERVYTLKEIKTPVQYAKNEMEVKFKTISDDNGNLEIQIISGGENLKANTVTQEEELSARVNFTVENTAKYRLELIKRR